MRAAALVAAALVAAALVAAGCRPSGEHAATAGPTASRPAAERRAKATSPAAERGVCRRGPSEAADAASSPGPGQAAAGAAGPVDGAPLRPANTFSIVARDPVTGDLGVAVQSHWFAVGTTVSWAEPGVGAIATQSFVEPAYGPRGLDLLRGGAAAPDALARLLAEDAGRDVRQVGFVDVAGRAAAHTGVRCIEHADHHVGEGYSVQANMMATAEVVPAMARAYEAARGDLAARMMAALEAAQAAGGDLRGCQSAALVVVAGRRSARPWADTRFDLRVDDSPDPIAELARLLRLARAYDHMNRGDAAVERNDMAGALEHYGAAARMSGGDAEMLFWQAVALAAHGEVDRALPIFRRVFAAGPRWIELLRRLTRPGILPDTPAGRALVERIRREAAPR